MISTSFLFSVSSKHFNAKSKHAYHCQVISMSKYGQVLLGVLDSIYFCFVVCGLLLISNLKHTQKIVTLCNVRRFNKPVMTSPADPSYKEWSRMAMPIFTRQHHGRWAPIAYFHVFPPSTPNFLPRFWKDKFLHSSPVHVKSLQVPGVVSSCSCTKTSQFGSTWRAKKMDMIDESGVWNPEIRIGHKPKYLGCSLVWENCATFTQKVPGFRDQYQSLWEWCEAEQQHKLQWKIMTSQSVRSTNSIKKQLTTSLSHPFFKKIGHCTKKRGGNDKPGSFGASLRSAINAMNLKSLISTNR